MVVNPLHRCVRCAQGCTWRWGGQSVDYGGQPAVPLELRDEVRIHQVFAFVGPLLLTLGREYAIWNDQDQIIVSVGLVPPRTNGVSLVWPLDCTPGEKASDGFVDNSVL